MTIRDYHAINQDLGVDLEHVREVLTQQQEENDAINKKRVK